MLVRDVVGHSRPASLDLNFVSFLYIVIVLSQENPLNPGGFVALHWFGNTFPVFVPTGVLGFFVSGSVTGYGVIVLSDRSCLLPVRRRKTKEAKINLVA